jgi:hypothetical protein
MNANDAEEGNAKANAKPESDAKETKPKDRKTMLDILIYICGACVVVGGLCLGYLGVAGALQNQRLLALWILYFTLFFVLTGAFLYFYKNLQKQPKLASSLPKERPEVFIERVTVEILTVGKPEAISLELKNRGKRTAHDVQVQTTHAHKPISFEGLLPSRVNNVPDSHWEIVPDGTVISVSRSTWLMTDKWMREIKERSRLFFMYGKFSYKDEDGTPYRVKFCYMFDPDFPRMMAICPDRYWPRETEEQ